VSTYREIVGKKIKKVSSDPSSGTEGEMWYNSTTGTLRGPAITEAWSSAAPLNTAIYYNCGAGDQTAALSFQGTAGPNPSTSTQTEEYNGSGWVTGGALPAARRSGMGAGTQTAGLSGGGASAPGTAQTSTDEYNGTAWTSVNALSTGRRYTAGCGTQTAAICVAGQNPGGTQIDSVEEYDGTNWTAGGAWPKAIRNVVSLGTQTATLGAGGYSTVTEVEAYEYDGSSWTATGDMNIARYVFQGFGTQTVGIVCGGEPQPAAANKTESYDGSTFSNSPATLGNPTAQAASGVASPGTAGIIFGDAAGGTAANTEEYNKSTNVITAAAFASGTNLPVTRGQGGGCGTQTAALQCGGIAASPTSNTTTSFEYDGSSWAASPGSLNAATRNNSNFGIQTAAVTIGSIGPISAAVDTYNGSTWTSGTSYPSPVSNIGAAGTNTAGLAWGGDQDPGYLNTTNEYNGSWTSSNTIPAARSNSACAGTQTAGLSVGGLVGPAAPSAPVVATSIEYDGSSWTAGNNDLVSRYNAGAAGIQTSALIFGGTTPPGGLISDATLYDGTSFVTQPSMGTARFLQTQGLGATSTVALAAAGQTTTRVATVEEFTGETTTANIKDFTATQS